MKHSYCHDFSNIDVLSLYKAIRLLEKELPSNQEVIDLLRSVFSSILDKEAEIYLNLTTPFCTFEEVFMVELSLAYRENRIPRTYDSEYIVAVKEAIMDMIKNNTPLHHACENALKHYYIKTEQVVGNALSETKMNLFKKYVHALYTSQKKKLALAYEYEVRNKTFTLRYHAKEYTWTYIEFGHRLYFDTWYVKHLRNNEIPDLHSITPKPLSNVEALEFAEKYIEDLQKRKGNQLPF